MNNFFGILLTVLSQASYSGEPQGTAEANLQFAQLYIDCTTEFVTLHAIHASSATEAVDGALGKCGKLLIQYRDAERAYFARSNPEKADERARIFSDNLELTTRRKLLAFALELRAKATTDTQ